LQPSATLSPWRSMRWLTAIALFLLLIGCNGGGGGGSSSNNSSTTTTAPPPAVQPSFTGISLSQTSATLNNGNTLTLDVILHYSDGSTSVLNAAGSVTWSASGGGVLSVTRTATGSGLISTFSRGTATVTANYQGYLASATITVVPVYLGIGIDPDPLWIPPEFISFFSAYALYNDGINQDISTTATWAVGNINLGAISNTTGTEGLFEALASGDTTVSATLGSDTANATVHVMPIHLINYAGALIIDEQGVSTSFGGDQGSGAAFVEGHNGTDWVPPLQINANQNPSDFFIKPMLGTNTAGARVAVWYGLNGLYAAYAGAGQSFGPVKTIPTNVSNFVNSFNDTKAVTVTGTGEALVIWTALGSDYISRYNPATGNWSQPQLLGNLSVIRAAFNTNGDAVMVWQITDITGIPYTVKSAIYINGAGPGTGLQTPQTIYTRSGSGVFDIAVDINANRDAVVAWAATPASGGVENVIYAAQYSTQNGWHAIGTLPMGTGYRADYVKAAMNASANTFVGWVDTSQSHIYVNRYTPLNGWETAQTISTTVGLGTPQIDSLAVASNGNAICIFLDGESFALLPIKYRRYVVGQGWTDMTVLQHIGRLGNSNNSLIASYNANGQGIMSWSEVTTDFDGTVYTFPTYAFLELAPNINP
jgi:hypothetical protein